MTPLQAFLLGLIQGITEFLPVSSSTHLAMARKLMDVHSGEALVYFDLICHLGTLLALLCILRKDLWNALTNPKSIALFSLALLPLIPAYFLFKPLRVSLSNYTGLFLLSMSALLFYASSKRSPRNQIPSEPKWKDVLCIGVAQSFALLPGFSRSGSTIATARLLGWEWKQATRFSFLLAVPTLLGGAFLETLRSTSSAQTPWNLCAIGFGASFIMGLGALRLLLWLVEKGTLKPFAWYCLLASFLALWLLQ